MGWVPLGAAELSACPTVTRSPGCILMRSCPACNTGGMVRPAPGRGSEHRVLEVGDKPTQCHTWQESGLEVV